MTDDSLREVINVMTLKSVEAGRIVMSYGDIGQYFYFILTGQVEILIPDQNKL